MKTLPEGQRRFFIFSPSHQNVGPVVWCRSGISTVLLPSTVVWYFPSIRPRCSGTPTRDKSSPADVPDPGAPPLSRTSDPPRDLGAVGSSHRDPRLFLNTAVVPSASAGSCASFGVACSWRSFFRRSAGCRSTFVDVIWSLAAAGQVIYDPPVCLWNYPLIASFPHSLESMLMSQELISANISMKPPPQARF